MPLESDLSGWSGRCRLFPLPGVVLLPHAVLPLHIFEPRYRQMTEDALEADRLVTIVQLRPSGLPTPAGDPAIEPVACLGKILNSERLADGRFNVLLVGLARVRLGREVPAGKLYRVAEAELLPDRDEPGPDDPRRAELIDLFRSVAATTGGLAPELARLLDGGLPLGVLADLIAHTLALPPAHKQALLDEPRVGPRVDDLITLLRQAQDRRPAPRFPPPFSSN